MRLKRCGVCFILVLSGLSFHTTGQGLQAGFFVQPQFTDFHYTAHPGSEVSSTSSGNVYYGMSISYFGSERLGMGTGLSYGRDGEVFNIKESWPAPKEYSFHYVVTSLKIPLLFKYRIPIKRTRLIFEGGPHLSYITDFVNNCTYGTFNYTDDYSRFQPGFLFGFGCELPIAENFHVFFKSGFEFNNLKFLFSESNQTGYFPFGRNMSRSAFFFQFGFNWENTKTKKEQP